jgi:hypothetical protein
MISAEDLRKAKRHGVAVLYSDISFALRSFQML